MYRTFFKPLFDLIVAFMAFVVLLPLFLIVAVAIKCDSRGPVFFKQERLGLLGKVFRIYKFRSMSSEIKIPVGSVKVFESDPRITRVGKFIRKTSIDELPQLINILRGEMSLIGPRPPVPYFPKKYDEYSDTEKMRFTVKPGLSGLVQVRHREINDWSINIPVDIEYVEKCSFWFDMGLFLSSLFVFFRTDNIYSKQ
jgi:lipopolysaccharide/colanic/teichoic acid biosynthesis glycosyltransferase